MKRLRISDIHFPGPMPSLKTLFRHLWIDIIPTLLMLLAMAAGMAICSFYLGL